MIILITGIGRLISECSHIPLVIPFYHVGEFTIDCIFLVIFNITVYDTKVHLFFFLYVLGMDDILHNEPPYIPHINKVHR